MNVPCVPVAACTHSYCTHIKVKISNMYQNSKSVRVERKQRGEYTVCDWIGLSEYCCSFVVTCTETRVMSWPLSECICENYYTLPIIRMALFTMAATAAPLTRIRALLDTTANPQKQQGVVKVATFCLRPVFFHLSISQMFKVFWWFILTIQHQMRVPCENVDRIESLHKIRVSDWI